MLVKGVSIADVLELELADRLTLVQDIWDSIAEEPESVPLTQRDREILDERIAAHQADSNGGSSWAEVKARILGE